MLFAIVLTLTVCANINDVECEVVEVERHEVPQALVLPVMVDCLNNALAYQAGTEGAASALCAVVLPPPQGEMI